MFKEEGLFTVAETDLQKELVSVAEDMPISDAMPPAPAPMPTEPPKPEQEEGWLASKKTEHFTQFLMDSLQRIPKPSDARNNQALMERALGQYSKLNNYMSQALRDDFDGKLNVEVCDKVRQKIERCVDELETMLDGIATLKKNRRKMRRGEDENSEMVKEATTPHFTGIQTQISAFENAIVRALINGVVSGGRNMEEMFEKIKEKYDITPREELAIFQVITDFGYPTFKDRLRIGDKDVDATNSNEGSEWQSQYYG